MFSHGELGCPQSQTNEVKVLRAYCFQVREPSRCAGLACPSPPPTCNVAEHQEGDRDHRKVTADHYDRVRPFGGLAPAAFSPV